MDSSSNYRLNKCQHCNGEGFIRVRDRDDYKNTEKMSPAELNAIVRATVRSSPVPPPVFGPEPPTLPDEGWTLRHLAAIRKQQWRWIQLALTIVLVGIAYVLGIRR